MARALRRAVDGARMAAAACEYLALKRRPVGPPVCLVVHDGYRHGAQLLALELARIFARVFRLSLHIVVLGPGPLHASFRRYGPVYPLEKQDGVDAEALAQRLLASGVQSALCNSTASGLFAAALHRAGIKCVALVHELPDLIAAKGLSAHAEALRSTADAIVFPAEAVRDRFPGGAPPQSVVRPQGVRRSLAACAGERAAARLTLKARFGIPEDAPLVLCVGYGDARKGIDLFVAMGAALLESTPSAYLLWLGGVAPEMADGVKAAVRATASPERFVFVPFTQAPRPFFAAADVFALTSREDPFPTVLLEALAAGLPAVAFSGAGGFEDVLRRGGGTLAPPGDVSAFAAHVDAFLNGPDKCVAARGAAIGAVGGAFSMRRYAFDLAHMLGSGPPRISAVVPNYNYARYLPQRLRSILDQTPPVYELIVLDDCSSDDSVAVARHALRATDVDWRLIENTAKADNVFAQWRRGVKEATGDFVWIAEADDTSDRGFLDAASASLRDAAIVMSYTQSRQIDSDGRTLDRDYLTYVSDIGAKRWQSHYVAEGRDEIRAALAVKNTIPNVSACVFRREALAQVLEENFDEISRFKVAGDWMTYVRLLQKGAVAFDARPLNSHRRHQRSVTASALPPVEALREIEDMQALVRREFAPGAETQAIAARYIETLRRQFGLG